MPYPKCKMEIKELECVRRVEKSECDEWPREGDWIEYRMNGERIFLRNKSSVYIEQQNKHLNT